MRAGLPVAALVLAALAFGLWRMSSGVDSSRAAFVPGVASVGVARVSEQELEERIEALGTTHSWESIEIRPAVTEFIAEIHFSDGQTVARGEVLVTLVQDEERAGLAEARAFLAEQERELLRIEGLVASKSLSRNQLDERRTLREIALARVAASEAALADRTIRAPFAGMLGLREASPGALVTPQTVITTLDDVESLRLDFPVPSLMLGKLNVGAQVEATTPAVAQRSFSGLVTGIDSRVNPVDRSVMMRARLDNTGLLLKPGLLMNVLLRHERRRGLVIPEEAVLHYQTTHQVLRVDPDDDNSLEQREIAIGLRSPGTVEVVSGLAEGDLVVTEGLSSVRPGDHVKVRDERAPAIAQ